MAIPATGPVRFSDINTELGNSSTDTISFITNNYEARRMAENFSSFPLAFSDFRGDDFNAQTYIASGSIVDNEPVSLLPDNKVESISTRNRALCNMTNSYSFTFSTVWAGTFNIARPFSGNFGSYTIGSNTYPNEKLAFLAHLTNTSGTGPAQGVDICFFDQVNGLTTQTKIHTDGVSVDYSFAIIRHSNNNVYTLCGTDVSAGDSAARLRGFNSSGTQILNSQISQLVNIQQAVGCEFGDGRLYFYTYGFAVSRGYIVDTSGNYHATVDLTSISGYTPISTATKHQFSHIVSLSNGNILQLLYDTTNYNYYYVEISSNGTVSSPTFLHTNPNSGSQNFPTRFVSSLAKDRFCLQNGDYVAVFDSSFNVLNTITFPIVSVGAWHSLSPLPGENFMLSHSDVSTNVPKTKIIGKDGELRAEEFLLNSVAGNEVGYVQPGENWHFVGLALSYSGTFQQYNLKVFKGNDICNYIGVAENPGSNGDSIKVSKSGNYTPFGPNTNTSASPDGTQYYLYSDGTVATSAQTGLLGGTVYFGTTDLNPTWNGNLLR